MRFVLDTNVVSEIMKGEPAPRVVIWLERQPEENMFTTVLSKAEILAGIAFLPEGRRRSTLEAVARGVFDIDFLGRVLSFEAAAASAYAEISAARRRAGRPIGTFDSIIAAIARSQDATIVTRNVGGFEHTGVSLLNPWDQI